MYSLTPARIAFRMAPGSAVVWTATMVASGVLARIMGTKSLSGSFARATSSNTTSGRNRSSRSRKEPNVDISWCSMTGRNGKFGRQPWTSSQSCLVSIAKPRVNEYMAYCPVPVPEPEPVGVLAPPLGPVPGSGAVGVAGVACPPPGFIIKRRTSVGVPASGHRALLLLLHFLQLLHRERLALRFHRHRSGGLDPRSAWRFLQGLLDERFGHRYLGPRLSGRNGTHDFRRHHNQQFGVALGQNPALEQLAEQRNIPNSRNLVQGFVKVLV